ncbi:MAG: BLUF domain-containing protein [Pseudomonadota bacterium]
MRLWKISYVSIASAPDEIAEADVREICAVAGPHNARSGITGILTYHAGRFAQIIEGIEDDLRQLMERIAADPRHHSLKITMDRAVDARQFDEWSMAYRSPKQFIQDQIENISSTTTL